MIPKSLVEIGWPDVQRLIETGRAEDDTIEFKRSFKGGDDYAGLNDKSREQSLDALAREVIAFLNTRGGDVVVGIRESEGASPVAQEITTVANVDDAADRVARGLAAIVEPAQTNISIRAIVDPNDTSRGVLVIRARPSLRAPHRSKRTRECFARRGYESVPMAMDEIQDLTMYRSRIRLEQRELLERQFAEFSLGRAEHRHLGDQIFHVRTVVFPLTEQSIQLGDDVLQALRNHNPLVYEKSGRANQYLVAFRGLYSRWRPVLRGRKQEDFQANEDPGLPFETPHYAARVIKESGICTFDYAHLADLHGKPGILSVWVVGYLAELCASLRELWTLLPSLLPATVRIGVRATGEVMVAYPDGFTNNATRLPEDVFFLPDAVLEQIDDLPEFFRQAQIDFFSLINLDLPEPYLLEEPTAREAAPSR